MNEPFTSDDEESLHTQFHVYLMGDSTTMSLSEQQLISRKKLLGKEWQMLQDGQYFIKYEFLDENITVLATDLVSLYAENLCKAQVEERFEVANPRAKMQYGVLFKRLEETLDDAIALGQTQKEDALCLELDLGSDEKEKSELKVNFNPPIFNIHLSFNVNKRKYKFTLKLKKMANEELKYHILAPTIVIAQTLNRENAQLRKKLAELEMRLTSTSSTSTSEDDVTYRVNDGNPISNTEVIKSFNDLQPQLADCIAKMKAEMGQGRFILPCRTSLQRDSGVKPFSTRFKEKVTVDMMNKCLKGIKKEKVETNTETNNEPQVEAVAVPAPAPAPTVSDPPDVPVLPQRPADDLQIDETEPKEEALMAPSVSNPTEASSSLPQKRSSDDLEIKEEPAEEKEDDSADAETKKPKKKQFKF